VGSLKIGEFSLGIVTGVLLSGVLIGQLDMWRFCLARADIADFGDLIDVQVTPGRGKKNKTRLFMRRFLSLRGKVYCERLSPIPLQFLSTSLTLWVKVYC